MIKIPFMPVTDFLNTASVSLTGLPQQGVAGLTDSVGDRKIIADPNNVGALLNLIKGGHSSGRHVGQRPPILAPVMDISSPAASLPRGGVQCGWWSDWLNQGAGPIGGKAPEEDLVVPKWDELSAALEYLGAYSRPLIGGVSVIQENGRDRILFQPPREDAAFAIIAVPIDALPESQRALEDVYILAVGGPNTETQVLDEQIRKGSYRVWMVAVLNRDNLPLRDLSRRLKPGRADYKEVTELIFNLHAVTGDVSAVFVRARAPLAVEQKKA